MYNPIRSGIFIRVRVCLVVFLPGRLWDKTAALSHSRRRTTRNKEEFANSLGLGLKVHDWKLRSRLKKLRSWLKTALKTKKTARVQLRSNATRPTTQRASPYLTLGGFSYPLGMQNLLVTESREDEHQILSTFSGRLLFCSCKTKLQVRERKHLFLLI